MVDETSPAERTAAWVDTLKGRSPIPPGLRDRLLFTLGILGLSRIGYFIPIPGVNTEALALVVEQADGTLFGYANLFTDGNLSLATVFALGITPYLSAAFVVQLLALFWPQLRRLSREGGPGRWTITRYARTGALILCVVQALALALFLERQTNIVGGLPLVYEPGWGFRLTAIAAMTAGTFFMIWLGDRISERGIGNGMALILVAGIVVRVPSATLSTLVQMTTGQIGLLQVLVVSVVVVAVGGTLIFLMRGRPAVRVRYPRRTVAGRNCPSATVPLRLKVNMSGVIPLLLAVDLIDLAVLAGTWNLVGGWSESVGTQFQPGMPLRYLLIIGLTLFLSFFYVAIVFDSAKLAENLRKYGGRIPSVPPGKPTEDHIDRVLMGTAAAWGLCLAAVAAVSELFNIGFRADLVPVIGNWLSANLPAGLINGWELPFYVGGAPLVIVLAVLMDTARHAQLQAPSSTAWWPPPPEPDSDDSALPRIADEDLVPVAVPNGASMEPCMSSVLESVGIGNLVRNDGVQDLFGLGRIGTGFNPFTGTPTVCVQRSRVKEAATLLSRIDREEHVGTVIHYFPKPQVAALSLTADLEVDDTLCLRRHGVDFEQVVRSMEINHEPVRSAAAATVVAVRVEQRVRPGTEVFSVRTEYRFGRPRCNLFPSTNCSYPCINALPGVVRAHPQGDRSSITTMWSQNSALGARVPWPTYRATSRP